MLLFVEQEHARVQESSRAETSSAPLVKVRPVVGASVPSLIIKSQRISWDHATTVANSARTRSSSSKIALPCASAPPDRSSASRISHSCSHSMRKYSSASSSACTPVPSGSMVVLEGVDSTSARSFSIIREATVVNVSYRLRRLPIRASTAAVVSWLDACVRCMRVYQLRSGSSEVRTSHGRRRPTLRITSVEDAAESTVLPTRTLPWQSDHTYGDE